MKHFTQFLAPALSIMTLSLTSPANADPTQFLNNSKPFDFGFSTAQKSDFIDKILANNASDYRLIPVMACINPSNGREGILCLDGFCDTSPSNLCNGHQGISPGHRDDSV